MANTLLKDVVAAKPASFNMTINENGTAIFPSSLTMNIADALGNPIDATAGTVSAQIHASNPGVLNDLSGTYDTSETSAFSLSADLSVAGKLTLNQAYVGSTFRKPGSYACSISAIDSAGGVRQLLAVGSVSLNQIA